MTPFLVGTAAVVIMHDERGMEQTLRAHALELGDQGATIEAAGPIESGTLAWVDFKALRISAIAHVHGCRRQGRTFRIALRFSCPPLRLARQGAPACKCVRPAENASAAVGYVSKVLRDRVGSSTCGR